MKTTIYFIVDLTYYLAQGMLLVFLMQWAQSRFAGMRKHQTSFWLAVQYVAVQLILNYSVWVKRMLYGSDMTALDSRRSMIKVLVSFFITYVFSRVLYKENRWKVCYFTGTFYAIIELVRFAFYIPVLWVLNLLVSGWVQLFIKTSTYQAEKAYQGITIIEALWNILNCVGVMVVSVWIARQIRKCVSMKDTYEKQELAFLIFPSAVGVVLCLLLRSIMYSVRGEDIYLLVNSNPEMNVLIPGICVLCIGMMIFAARLLQRLRKESNKRIELSVYQNRIREMEQHMQEMERLYTGIRGMKHDMKNYIADMDALMKQEKESDTMQGALRQYLDSLQHSMEQLDIKYHTGNPVTDVVIQRYVALAKEHQIEFFTEFIFPKDMNIDAFDISIILNNGLENALEACKGQDSGEKRIELTSYGKENMFFIVIRNSFQGQLVKREDKILSTKEDSINHGLGLENIKACAQKYFGTASTTVEGGYFELAVMLQKREREAR